MTTMRDVVTEALIILGIVDAIAEPVDATMAAGALRVLHTLIDSWAIEGLLVYTIDRQVFSLIASTQTYTLGPGGTWNTMPLYGAGSPRPVQVANAQWRNLSQDFWYPVYVMSDADYQGLADRGMTGTQVTALHYAPTFPLGTVFLYPVPTLTGQMALFLWHPYDTQSTLDTLVAFPPGYQRMLEYNLAVDLSERYPGTLRPSTAALAAESKDKVESMNLRVPVMTSDLIGLTPSGGLGWSRFLMGG